MALINPLSDALKRLLSKDQVDSVDRLIRNQIWQQSANWKKKEKRKGQPSQHWQQPKLLPTLKKEQKRQELFLKLRRRQKLSE